MDEASLCRFREYVPGHWIPASCKWSQECKPTGDSREQEVTDEVPFGSRRSSVPAQFTSSRKIGPVPSPKTD